jgi:hypothetical protein
MNWFSGQGMSMVVPFTVRVVQYVTNQKAGGPTSLNALRPCAGRRKWSETDFAPQYAKKHRLTSQSGLSDGVSFDFNRKAISTWAALRRRSDCADCAAEFALCGSKNRAAGKGDIALMS